MEKTTLYLPRDLQLGLKAAAKREKRPQAAIVRDAVERYLSEAPQRTLSFIGAAREPLPRGVDSTNAKAWIREERAKARDARQGAASRARKRSKRADG